MVNLQNFVKIIHFWFKVIKDRLNMRSNGRHVIYLLLFTNKFMRIHGIPFGWNSVANSFLLCLISQNRSEITFDNAGSYALRVSNNAFDM